MDAEDLARAGRRMLSEQDLDPGDASVLQQSMSDTRVVLSVDTVGMDPVSAYQLAKSEATRLWAWPGLIDPLLDADEPEQIHGGVLRVGVLVGVTELAPVVAVRRACAVLKHRRWSAPSARTIAEHQFAWWEATPRPSRGAVRIEVHVAPGLSPITESRRQELLADPRFAYLHHILRMP